MNGKVRVVKLGGSLLDLPQLPDKLQGWLSRYDGLNVVIVGGGPLVEAVRQWDRLHGLDPQQAHWLCIDLMSTSARVLAQLLPAFPLENNFVRLRSQYLQCSTPEPRTVLFDPSRFLRTEESRRAGVRLPEGWHVTSDSIAARIAELLPAEELVLLKSVGADPAASWKELAQQEIVDGYFPQAARNLRRVTLLNFRRI